MLIFQRGTLQSREGDAHPQEPGKARPAALLLAACPCLDLWYLLCVPGTKAGISEALAVIKKKKHAGILILLRSTETGWEHGCLEHKACY